MPGDVPDALAAAERAVAAASFAAAENVLGRALIAAGKRAEGRSHLNAAWQDAKTDSHLAFDYAQVLLRARELRSSGRSADPALEAHPDDAQLVLALGVARYGQRRFDDAITLF